MVNTEVKTAISNYYEILGISREATLKEIKRAYILKVDTMIKSIKNGEKTYALIDLILVNKALATLSTPTGRYIYDYQLDGRRPNFNGYSDEYLVAAYEGKSNFSARQDEKLAEYLDKKVALYYMERGRLGKNKTSKLVRDERDVYDFRTYDQMKELFDCTFLNLALITTELHYERIKKK